MKDFVPLDPNTPNELQIPIEEYPGFIGQSHEGVLLFVDEVTFLQSIDWERYRDLVSGLKDPIRHFNIEIGLKTLLIPMDPFEDLAFALDEIPSLDVQIDKESGVFTILLKEGYEYEEAFGSILSFAKAVEVDIEYLEELESS